MHKIVIILSAQNHRLIEVILLSTHNTFFGSEKPQSKIFDYTLLSGGQLNVSQSTCISLVNL